MKKHLLCAVAVAAVLAGTGSAYAGPDDAKKSGLTLNFSRPFCQNQNK